MKAIFDYESDNSVMRTKVALKVNLMKLMTNWKKVRRILQSAHDIPSQKSKPRFNQEKVRFNWDEYNFHGINRDLSKILS